MFCATRSPCRKIFSPFFDCAVFLRSQSRARCFFNLCTLSWMDYFMRYCTNGIHKTRAVGLACTSFWENLSPTRGKACNRALLLELCCRILSKSHCLQFHLDSAFSNSDVCFISKRQSDGTLAAHGLEEHYLWNGIFFVSIIQWICWACSIFRWILAESLGLVPFSVEYLNCRHVRTDGLTDWRSNPGWAGYPRFLQV